MSDLTKDQKVGHEMISGLTQLLILLILKKGPQHGYELASRLEPIYGRRLSPGTIYPLLQRMENKEYIQSKSLTVAGRERKTYVITRMGRIALDNAQLTLHSILNIESSGIDQEAPGVELLKSLAQFRILLLLEQSPMHGYDLVEKLDNYFGQKIALGTIYPSLHRLVDKNYIISKSEWEGDRERKVYELTPLGLTALKNVLVEITAIANDEIFN
ncbi:MAG: PadR family transcriptional regulator [Asgard group archaeon]|nr:PadR family transcriptional regulator [Asgard group archaeon]